MVLEADAHLFHFILFPEQIQVSATLDDGVSFNHLKWALDMGMLHGTDRRLFDGVLLTVTSKVLQGNYYMQRC